MIVVGVFATIEQVNQVKYIVMVDSIAQTIKNLDKGV